MSKEIQLLCPHCRKDLKVYGFYSYEEVLMRFEWDWIKSKEYFKADKGSEEGSDSEPEFYCSSCEEVITLFVREHNLV